MKTNGQKTIKAALVTGGTGFVGRHLIKALLDHQIPVRALVRSSSNTEHLNKSEQLKLVFADLTDPETLQGITEGCDVVFHCACATSGTFDAQQDAYDFFKKVNVEGTVNLANETLADKDHPRFIYLSSTAAMGTPATVRVDETSPCNPVAPYQRSKREAELALLELYKTKKLDVVIIRSPLIAGAGKKGGELLTMFKLISKGLFPYLGWNKNLRKPLIMVDDLGSALFHGARRGRSGEIYLVNSEPDRTLYEMLEAAGVVMGRRRTHVHIPVFIARIAGRLFEFGTRLNSSFKPPLTTERVNLFLADRELDISKAKRELGFEPIYNDLQVMFQRTYDWYKSTGEL